MCSSLFLAPPSLVASYFYILSPYLVSLSSLTGGCGSLKIPESDRLSFFPFFPSCRFSRSQAPSCLSFLTLLTECSALAKGTNEPDNCMNEFGDCKSTQHFVCLIILRMGIFTIHMLKIITIMTREKKPTYLIYCNFHY